MKLVVINQATVFARHWGRWYRVQRSGEDWRPLEIGKKYVKSPTTDEITENLLDKFPVPNKMPAILDELAADAEVEKTISTVKRRTKKHKH